MIERRKQVLETKVIRAGSEALNVNRKGAFGFGGREKRDLERIVAVHTSYVH